MRSIIRSLSFLALCQTTLAVNFTLVKDYAGKSFFDDWDYYGSHDDTTHGHVDYVNKSDSASLSYVNDAGRAIIKVDNTSVVSTYPYLEKRNSVCITTKDYFSTGSVFVVDAAHLPFGCSVWPSIWTKGNDWPNNGEIDIIEGVNTMTFNQMALHANKGCMAASNTDQTGALTAADCNSTAGCTVSEKTPNSFGQAFADNGGGVWAAQFDVAGIFIWFWGRSKVPASITTATNSIDISAWGPPSAAYLSSGCDISTYFGAQQIVIDITLCGDWAGAPDIFAQQCGGNASDPYSCYYKCVGGAGTPDLAKAYFELNYIRAFSLNDTAIVSGNGSALPTGSGGSPTSSSSGTSPSGNGGSSKPNGAPVVTLNRLYAAIAAVSFFSWILM